MIDWLEFDNIWSFLFLVFLVVFTQAVVKYYETQVSSTPENKDNESESEILSSEETEASSSEEPLVNGVFLQMSKSDLQSLAYHMIRLREFKKLTDCSSNNNEGRDIIVDNLDFEELKEEIPVLMELIERENSS